MKWKFASRKFASWKFASRRFAGDRTQPNYRAPSDERRAIRTTSEGSRQRVTIADQARVR